MKTTDKEIEELAFWWSVDYKPFQTDLEYREYARYGFEQGFKECLTKYKELKRKGLLNK